MPPAHYPNGDYSWLAQAREWVLEVRDEKLGGICPCCGQLAKTYRRRMNRSMAVFLLRLYALDRDSPPTTERGFWELNRDFTGGTDYALTERWDLTEQDRDERGRRRPNLWRITEFGRRYVRGLETTPTLWVYNNETIHVDKGERTGLREALGAEFHRDDLWVELKIERPPLVFPRHR